MPTLPMPKKRKRTSTNNSTRPPVNPDGAREHLSAGRLREAVAAFKALLKDNPADPSLAAGLATAYAARADQLAAKGMAKEALVMWENRATLHGVAASPEHAVLLLNLGQLDRLAGLLRGSPELRAQPVLHRHLAAHYLAGNDAIAELLPDDDSVRVHGPAARAILANFCAGQDDTALAASLAAIPFRSPYRDLVQIIRAMLKLPDAPGEAEGLLARVGDGSAFVRLRDAARLALAPESRIDEALRGAGRATWQVVGALRGWSTQRQRLWQEIQRLGHPVSHKELLRLMHRQREPLGEEWVHSRGLRLLLPGFPDNQGWLNEIRRITINPDDFRLLAAWSAERDHDPWDMLEDWTDCADALIPQTKAQSNGDAALRIALMLRRPDRVLDLLRHGDGNTESRDLAEEAAEKLERSLSFDPDDRESYLRLIRYRIKTKTLKEARALLKDAQTRWPEDKQVLTVAIETALAGGAFKKAAGIARTMLAIDPINSGVRLRLVSAHLAHARKSLVNRRPDLAHKALQEAREWVRGEAQTEQIELVTAFATRQQDLKAGNEALRRIAERLGNGLTARLVIGLESHHQRRPMRDLLRQLGLARFPSPDLADLRGFLERLRLYLDGGGMLPLEIGELFAKPLRASAILPLDKAQCESACETLLRARLESVRRAFAEAALKRWKGEPVFELHAVEAAHADHPFQRPSRTELRRLEDAIDRARDLGDTRVLHRLTELRESFSSPFERRGGFINPFGMDEDEVLDLGPIAMFEQLIGSLGVPGIEALLETNHPMGLALRQLRDSLGAARFRELIESITTDPSGDFDPSGDAPGPRRGGPRSKPRPGPNNPRMRNRNDQPELFDLFDPDKDT